MIKRLNEIFLSQHRLIKGWELPLAGLLLMAGLVATVSTLQSAASQKQTQTIASNSIAPKLDAEVSPLQEQGVNPTAATSSLEAPAPQQPAKAIAPKSIRPSFEAPTPQPQEQVSAPSLETPAFPSQEPGVDSTSAAPSLRTPAPQPQEQSVNSTSVAPTLKTAGSQLQKPADKSVSVAKSLARLNRHTQAGHKVAVAQLPAPNRSISDGTYVYGQTSEPQQIGKEYLVFEARQGKVVGAIYMAGSEYSCFQGTLASNLMNLTVANSYNQTAIAHTIDAQPTQVAASGAQINLQNTYDSLSYPHTIRLEDYKPLSKVSDNDKEILNSCRSKSNVKGEVE